MSETIATGEPQMEEAVLEDPARQEEQGLPEADAVLELDVPELPEFPAEPISRPASEATRSADADADRIDWSVDPRHLEALQKSFRQSDLVLYLGAGVSISAGAPSWNELLRRLTYRMLEEEAGMMAEEAESREMQVLFYHFRRRSPLILARYLRQYFGGRFRDEVRSALYQDLDPEQSSILMEEIAWLATPPRTGTGLVGIVTYNFDDLLERAFRRRQLRYTAMVGPGSRCDLDMLPIHHVQGYLPREEGVHGISGQPGELVFSEESYHAHYLNPYSWANLTQLHHLGDHTGLFIGLSMTDPNLRRLLDVVHEQDSSRVHYAVLPTPQAEAVGLFGRESEQSVALQSSKLSRALRQLEDRVAGSLGLQLVWVNSFHEIPQLIREIR